MSATLIALLTTLATTGVAYLRTRANDKRTASLREMLDDVVRRVLNTAGTNLENIQARAEEACRNTLEKVGITGPAASLLVHEFAEYAAAEFHERWEGLARNMQAMADAVSKVSDAFNVGPIVPPLPESMFERTPPTTP